VVFWWPFPDAVDEEDALESEEEGSQPDRSVVDIFEKLFLLRSNPLGLERFLARRRSKLSYCSSLGI
jgi:hypothetical protein